MSTSTLIRWPTSSGAANGLPAAVNVGVRPTFETGRGLLIEAYLIDFEGDLYGRTLRIAFIGRLRGERRFESVDELVEQMGRDVEAARAQLVGKGVAASEVQDYPWGRFVFFQDPDGNAWALQQMVPQGA